HAERRRRVRTFLPAVPAHPAPAVLLLGAERMLDLRRAGTIRRDQAPCRRGVPRHRRRRVHRQPAATGTAARVTWAVAGIVGRRAWRESPAVRAIPLWPDPTGAFGCDAATCIAGLSAPGGIRPSSLPTQVAAQAGQAPVRKP